MLIFNRECDAIIISEMIAHGEYTFGPAVFWTKNGMLGPLLLRAMSMPHIKVDLYVSANYRIDDPEAGEVLLPKEISFQWYKDVSQKQDMTDTLYTKSWQAWHEYEPRWEKSLNGGWINHGTDLMPGWSSHT